MKKIKTLNKLLSSLTLLSPLSGVGFNNQYQNTQNVITKSSNNSLTNYVVNQTNEQRKMGDVTVNVSGTQITSYAAGSGTLKVDSDITLIGAESFYENNNIHSLDLSKATSLTKIDYMSFACCSNLTGDLVIPSSVTSIGQQAFYTTTNITSLDLSKATSLTSIGDNAFSNCSNLTGDLVIPSNLSNIGDRAFCFGAHFTQILVDSSNQNFCLTTNLGPDACVVLAGTDGIWKDNSKCVGSLALGKLVIPSSITSIAEQAFWTSNITSLDLSQATSLTTIGRQAFWHCEHLRGNIIISKTITTIDQFAFQNVQINNLAFLSETPPTFGENWQPTITGKVYVPSEQAKSKYTSAQYFTFNEDQIEIGLPPEPSPKKSNTELILGLVFGLGIPILAAVGFGIWYFTKKKKNNS